MKDTIKRRQFISKSLFASVSCCLGCASLLTGTASAKGTQQTKPFQDRINQDAGMTYNQVFTLAYRDAIIPQLVELSNEIGQDSFIKMLKKVTDNVYSKPEFMNRLNSNLPEDFWSNILDVEVLESTDIMRTYKITNCLWAKIFLEANAGDIGYALVCYGDYGAARAKNETLERDKTLMQGHDYCLLKWTKNT